MKFLTDEWFNKVDELRGAAGDLEIPDELKGVAINVNVKGDGDATTAVHLDGGDFKRGHSDASEVTLTLSSELVKKVFIEGDAQAGMQAFMAGEIQVEGDMTKLMAMQTAQPSDKQKALLKDVRDMTTEW